MDYTKYIHQEGEDMDSCLMEAAPEMYLREKLLREGPDPDRVYTMEDIEALPEEIQAELNDGKIFYMQMPTASHQDVAGGMYLAVANYIRAKRGNCKVYIPPYGVYLNNDDKTFFVPDLTVICDRDKLDEKGCHGAPDWIVEVTSPSTKKRDYGLKLFRYRDAGVREYWIIDLQQRIVMVYVFDTEPEDAGIYSFEDEITPSLYPDLKIRIADMLG